MKPALGLMAGIVSAIGLFLYARSVKKKATVASRSSWLIWALGDLMLLGSQTALDVGSVIWLPIAHAVGASLIAVMAWRYSKSQWTLVDALCILLAAVSGSVWIVNGQAEYLLLNILVDLAGVIPTIQKSWANPRAEDMTAWMVLFLGATMNFFALEQWTLSIVAYPLYQVVSIWWILLVVVRPRKNQKPRR